MKRNDVFDNTDLKVNPVVIYSTGGDSRYRLKS